MSARKLRLVSASIGAVLAVGLLSAAPALASGPAVGKIYDCWSFDEESGFNKWVQSVELKTRSTYLVGATRKGNRLVGNVAQGRYQVHKQKLTFTSGPYAIHHITAIYKPAGKGYRPHKENEFDSRFDLYEQGENFMTCYEH